MKQPARNVRNKRKSNNLQPTKHTSPSPHASSSLPLIVLPHTSYSPPLNIGIHHSLKLGSLNLRPTLRQSNRKGGRVVGIGIGGYNLYHESSILFWCLASLLRIVRVVHCCNEGRFWSLPL